MRSPNSQKDIRAIVSVLRKSKKFIMVAHECPDGDSLGCAMAMMCILRKLKRDVVVMTDMVPEKYAYLPGVGEIKATPPRDLSGRVAMLFDTPTLERLGSLRPLITRCAQLINIDHHVSNSHYGALNWVDCSAASVGEQVYQIMKLLGVKLDRNIATCLYTSLVTDTGKFQYANTTTNTHRLAAELLSTGIDHQRITEYIYEDYPKEKLALLAGALQTLKLEFGGKVAWLVITHDLLKKSGASLEWADDVINHARGIRGVEVAVVFKEAEQPGSYKVSFRSRNPKVVDVNKIACAFGGGGHQAASGCNMRGSLDDVAGRVIAELKKSYGQN